MTEEVPRATVDESQQQMPGAILSEVGKVLVGQDEMARSLLVGLLCGGHILLEGLPGLAKTLAVQSLARAIDTGFARIQFTPDMLPADVLGVSIYEGAAQNGAVTHETPGHHDPAAAGSPSIVATRFTARGCLAALIAIGTSFSGSSPGLRKPLVAINANACTASSSFTSSTRTSSPSGSSNA